MDERSGSLFLAKRIILGIVKYRIEEVSLLSNFKYLILLKFCDILIIGRKDTLYYIHGSNYIFLCELC